MHNPFKPPAANLERPLSALLKPSAVVLATRLLWTVVGLSLLSLMPGMRTDYWEDAAKSSIEELVGITIFAFALYSLLIVFIGRRANWARWSMLVFTVVGWMSSVMNIPSLIAQGGAVVIAELLITIAEIYAIKLLFFGEGAQWFKAS